MAQGGFSTVYLARQIKDQQQVAIKEYHPAKLTKREGLKLVPIDPVSTSSFLRGRALFMEEAKLLTTIKHPNIVSVLNFFLANDTAYLVMNYDYGNTLAHTLKDPNNTVDSKFLLEVFLPVMRCVKSMHHRGLLHLDIKPDNILLRPSNNPLILDFGSALSFKKPQQLVSHSLTKGFAAPEQHDKLNKIGPWSDIYAIGASMRACLDRKTPPVSIDTQAISKLQAAHELNHPGVHEKILYAIDWAMKVKPAQRPQTIDDFLNAMSYL